MLILALLATVTFGCDNYKSDTDTNKWRANFSGDRELTLSTKFEADQNILDSSTTDIITLGYRNDTAFASTSFWSIGRNPLEGGAEIRNDTLILYYWVSDSLNCDTNKTQAHLTYYLKAKMNGDRIELGSPVYIDKYPPKRQKCNN